MTFEAIEIKEDKTVREFIDGLILSTPVLMELNGEVFYPDEDDAKMLKRGDRVTLIPIIAGG
ncbi:MAG: MoaD/ThiS family protein [Dehalococcoidales bacterium]|nr:MoaD/ThiS family protein [Dehalococcoidales bacterium]